MSAATKRPRALPYRDNDGVVHGYEDRTQYVSILLLCGVSWYPGHRLRSANVTPSRKNLTYALPSVKTPITCLGCLAAR